MFTLIKTFFFKAFIPAESKGKIKFIKKKDLPNLHKHIPQENLEAKYGGKLENFLLFIGRHCK